MPYDALDVAHRLARLDWANRAPAWDRRARELLFEYYRRLLPFWPAEHDRIFPDDGTVLATLTGRLSGSERAWVLAQCSALPATAPSLTRRLITLILTCAVLQSNDALEHDENPGTVLLELFEAGYELSHSHGAIDVLFASGMTTVPRPDRQTVLARTAADAERLIGNVRVRVGRPVPAAEDSLLEDWSQLNVYGQPLWGHTFVDVTRRISIETTTDALVLFDRHDAASLEHLFRCFDIGDQRAYAIRVADSTDPLREGYLRCLRFSPAAADTQTVGLADIMTAFVGEEIQRFQTMDICEFYAGQPIHPRGGTSTGVGEPAGWTVFGLVDFPHFDSGTMRLGFGLLSEGKSARRHVRLWSRLVHYHK